MEISDFSRILTHLRKEKGISQKTAAEHLGVSQSLLSHYEKGIRECGLMFLVRAADFYGVTVDYLLGRSYDKNGNSISVDELPDEDAAGKGNVGVKSIVSTLNKKLICNSVSVLIDSVAKVNNKNLTNEVSSYLSVSVYKAFRMLYNSNSKNPQSFFGDGEKEFMYMSDASINSSLSKISKILSDEKYASLVPMLDQENIKSDFPLLSASFYNLLQNVENKIGARKK